jgi:hypothetical protein
MRPAPPVARRAAYALVAACAVVFVWGVLLSAASDRPEPALATLGDPWDEASLREAAGGVPLAWLRALFLVLQLLPAAAGLVAALLVLRGADTWFRCYLAVVLSLFGTMNGAIPDVLESEIGGVLGAATGMLQGLAWVSLFPLMYVFPDGRIRPRWARWCILGWALVLPYFLLASLLGRADPSDPALTLPLLALFGTATYAAVHRYRKLSTPEQRRQTRGVVAALLLWFGYVALLVITPLGRLLREESGRGLASSAAAYLISFSIVALVPAAVAVGVLRHRLYDVDVWVNRTLVYTRAHGHRRRCVWALHAAGDLVVAGERPDRPDGPGRAPRDRLPACAQPRPAGGGPVRLRPPEGALRRARRAGSTARVGAAS